MPIEVIVADYGVRTPAGPDIRSSWEGILSGACSVTANGRMGGRAPNAVPPSAVCEGVRYSPSSMLMQMLSPLLPVLKDRVPSGSLLLLATTVGEIDLLESAVLRGERGSTDGRLDATLSAVSRGLGLSRRGCVVSCACASSSMAMALGASLIRSGRETDVVVIGCDVVSEFVLAGFAALAALSPEPARPFDKARQGLSLGEGVGWCWLRGLASGRGSDAGAVRLTGWSCRADAYHMTAPEPQGEGLAAAVGGALRLAGIAACDVGGICAHGTGTRYNDDMEGKAFARALPAPGAPPVFSIKGHIGHTLGAAGVIEAAIAIESSRRRLLPPTAGCICPDPEGTPVTRERVHAAKSAMLSTNSGFGGVNTALVVDASGSPGPGGVRTVADDTGRVVLSGLAWATKSELGTAVAGSPVVRPLPAMDDPDALFRGGYRNWGRVAPQARLLACALEAGFRDLHIVAGAGKPAVWGLFGLNATGCHAENVAFFSDYVGHGRSLARGALFVQTLPSTAVAEASIHFALRGPVCHFVDPDLDFSRIVGWGCAIMECEGGAGFTVASFEEDLVLCAFLSIEGRGGGGADMKRVGDILGVIPRATPPQWLARGIEGRL